MFGTLTTVAAGGGSTLSQAVVQRVEIATDGAAATVTFPASPNDGDGIYVHTTGTSVVNQATINPNGKHIEDPLAPGSATGTVNVHMGPNPGASALFVYKLSTTLWELFS